MMLFNFPSGLVPPGMYRAIMPDGHVIKEAGRENWFARIRQHYKNNGYALPEDWKEYYQDQWCRTAPPGYCQTQSGIPVNKEAVKLTIEDLKHGMQVLWNITRHPDPLVSRDVATERAAICAACPGNVDVPGCKPCIQLSNTIGDIRGKGSTPSDSYLRTCFACKCSNQAQVWVKKEILESVVTDVQYRMMREMNPSCWKAKLENQGE